jgi:drug/metabolite transporter (DMT)-like permease
LLIGSILLGALQATRPFVRPTQRELALLVVAGLLWFGAYNLALNDAERRVDAGTASMLVLVAPIIIIALAAVFLKERTTPNLLSGGLIAFAGVILIGFATTTHRAPLLGVILCLVAALASAIGVVAEKPVLGCPRCKSRGRVAPSARSRVCHSHRGYLTNSGARHSALPAGCSFSASSRRPWPSRRGPTRSPAVVPDDWRQPPT